MTLIQRHEHKKKFIFEVHTSIEGRVFYIMAESEAVMKDWMEAIMTVWTLHMMKYVCCVSLGGAIAVSNSLSVPSPLPIPLSSIYPLCLIA